MEHYTKSYTNDGTDPGVLRMHIRHNSDFQNAYIVIRSDPNIGQIRLKSESFVDPVNKLLTKMWPTKDDSDGHVKNTDNSFSKMRFTSSNDNPVRAFIADSERYLRKRMNSNKNYLLESKDIFSEPTLERRVYGIHDFVNDFLRIVSN